MDKNEFTNRLILAGETARKFAASYIPEPLPELLCYTLARFDNPQGRRGPVGTMKFIGGRFLKPEELRRVPPHRAASLLWFDGKVPAWINIGVYDFTERETELMISFCDTLLPADEDKLPLDVHAQRGNPLIPFRIRGPAVSDNWRSPTDEFESDCSAGG